MKTILFSVCSFIFLLTPVFAQPVPGTSVYVQFVCEDLDAIIALAKTADKGEPLEPLGMKYIKEGKCVMFPSPVNAHVKEVIGTFGDYVVTELNEAPVYVMGPVEKKDSI